MGGAVTVNAVGNIFNNTQLVRAALGTFTVQSGGGNVFQGTATPVFATSSATTPAFTVKGNDLAVDIGGSGMSASRVGQFLLNTGSRGTIAPNKLVISNGVAWVQPDNMGSTFVN
jgi:hypothetical protein